jgi:hypothetical protein
MYVCVCACVRVQHTLCMFVCVYTCVYVGVGVGVGVCAYTSHYYAGLGPCPLGR